VQQVGLLIEYHKEKTVTNILKSLSSDCMVKKWLDLGVFWRPLNFFQGKKI